MAAALFVNAMLDIPTPHATANAAYACTGLCTQHARVPVFKDLG